MIILCYVALSLGVWYLIDKALQNFFEYRFRKELIDTGDIAVTPEDLE